VQMTVYGMARFEVLRAVLMEMQIIRNVTPCRLINIYWCSDIRLFILYYIILYYILVYIVVLNDT
jgi:hypothetical protein